jgi:hypothetical protein
MKVSCPFICRERIWGGTTAPLALNLGTRCMWVVNFVRRPLYSWGRTCSTHCVGGWVRPKDGLKVRWKRNCLPAPGIYPRLLGCLIRRFLYCSNKKHNCNYYVYTLACDCIQKEQYASVSFQFHTRPDKTKLGVYCSRYSAGGIVTNLGLDNQEISFLFPVRGKRFFSSQNAQTDIGAHFVPCLTCTD